MVLKKLHPKIYQIYGIFNFKTEELIYVSLNYDDVEIQFELGNYGEEFDIVCFETAVY
ncbi:MAG TPA: hypothetical protein PLC59_00225 [Bacteroidales bacterium]|nr:hypothetical protein [Bacteroidales bacterium]HQI44489.1 hypothetical protein [Bacteroidales bacterium]